MQSWPHNVFDGSLATGPCSKHWLCTERTVCMSWAMARRLSQPCKGQGLGQTVSASQAKHVRSRDLLSKQFYINAWMCPKPKPQRIYNQKSSTFGASTFLTSQVPMLQSLQRLRLPCKTTVPTASSFRRRA